jgi:cytochrome c oxidase assembly factor CtaG
MLAGRLRQRGRGLPQSALVSPHYGWSLTPGPLVLLGLVSYAYVRRWRTVRADAGSRDASGWRLAAFAGGVLMTLAALVSPIDVLAEQLFVMHMLQHVLLLDLASILFLASLTRVLLRPATRRLQRLEQAAGPLGHPVFAIVLYAGGMVLWHVPAAYDGALRHPAIHALEHVTFASAGLLYWWHLMSPIRSRHRLGGLGPVAYMVTTKVLVGLLGIVLTFSPTALYDFYVDRPRYWGLSAVDDQAIGGAFMALEQSIVMGIALVALFFRQLTESERDEQRAERYASP